MELWYDTNTLAGALLHHATLVQVYSISISLSLSTVLPLNYVLLLNVLSHYISVRVKTGQQWINNLQLQKNKKYKNPHFESNEMGEVAF